MEKSRASLTERVLLYQKTRCGLGELVAELAPRVYAFPRRTMGYDEDACGDFYVFFHPRLLRLIGRFRDQGKPFESYLCAVLGWQLRNFARERKSLDRAWNVTLRMNAGSEEPDAPDGGDGHPALIPVARDIAGVIKTGADQRNLLLLVLKCSRVIDADKARAIAPLAGVSAERLLELVSTLSRMRAPRERRQAMLRERRNRAFARERLLEAELSAEGDPQRRAAIGAAIALTRSRMHAAMERMARVGMAPTNKEIAMLLGLPKGTVDSGLYWLKRKLAAVYDPDCQRTA